MRKSGSAFTYSTFESWGLVTFIYYYSIPLPPPKYVSLKFSFLLSIQHHCQDHVETLLQNSEFVESLTITVKESHRYVL